MRFFLIDDDPAVRSMVADIIEDEELGEVAGEAEDGAYVDGRLLEMKKIDILFIDLLMPLRDGIQTIRDIGSDFHGKIIMISQVETKEMIGEAYALGVDYYITKPVNRLEVLGVVRRVTEHLQMQRTVRNIQQTLRGLEPGPVRETEAPSPENHIAASGRYLLSELGMIGESGGKDLLDMLDYLSLHEKEATANAKFPSLKEIFANVALSRLGESASAADLSKEIKASEQRVRRAIFQAQTHFASLGLTDYAHPKFEHYASRFFDFTEIRKLMLELKHNAKPTLSQTRINTKKFVQVLYLEAKKGAG